MPPKPLPTQERLKQVLHYDPETGVFTRIAITKKQSVGATAGYVLRTRGGNENRAQKCYISIGVDNDEYRAHRLAWKYMTGNDPVDQIDHKDSNGLNNAWSNLREANQTQNNANKKNHFSSKLGVKGVWQRKNGKFSAEIVPKTGKVSLGTYQTIEEAKAAYNAAAKMLYGEFAKP